jgi:hypothetical protein
MESPILGFSALPIFSFDRAPAAPARPPAAAAVPPSSRPQLEPDPARIHDTAVRPNRTRSYEFTLTKVPHLERDFDASLRARLDHVAKIARQMGDAVITTRTVGPACVVDGGAEVAVKFYLAGKGVPISAYEVYDGVDAASRGADDGACAGPGAGPSDIVIDVTPRSSDLPEQDVFLARSVPDSKQAFSQGLREHLDMIVGTLPPGSHETISLRTVYSAKPEAARQAAEAVRSYLVGRGVSPSAIAAGHTGPGAVDADDLLAQWSSDPEAARSGTHMVINVARLNLPECGRARIAA